MRGLVNRLKGALLIWMIEKKNLKISYAQGTIVSTRGSLKVSPLNPTSTIINEKFPRNELNPTKKCDRPTWWICIPFGLPIFKRSENVSLQFFSPRSIMLKYTYQLRSTCFCSSKCQKWLTCRLEIYFVHIFSVNSTNHLSTIWPPANIKMHFQFDNEKNVAVLSNRIVCGWAIILFYLLLLQRVQYFVVCDA